MGISFFCKKPLSLGEGFLTALSPTTATAYVESDHQLTLWCARHMKKLKRNGLDFQGAVSWMQVFAFSGSGGVVAISTAWGLFGARVSFDTYAIDRYPNDHSLYPKRECP